jgi:hypothetical protein
MAPAAAASPPYDGPGEFLPPLILLRLLKSPDLLLSIRLKAWSDLLLDELMGLAKSGLRRRPIFADDLSLAILADRRLSRGEAWRRL